MASHSPDHSFVFIDLLQSELDPERFYIGITDDLDQRLEAHNAYKGKHTSNHRLWRIKIYVAFSAKDQAVPFEPVAFLMSNAHLGGTAATGAMEIFRFDEAAPEPPRSAGVFSL